MAGTCGTPGLFRNLRHSLRQTATRVLGTTISTLRACGAGGRGGGWGGGGRGGGLEKAVSRWVQNANWGDEWGETGGAMRVCETQGRAAAPAARARGSG